MTTAGGDLPLLSPTWPQMLVSSPPSLPLLRTLSFDERRYGHTTHYEGLLPPLYPPTESFLPPSEEIVAGSSTPRCEIDESTTADISSFPLLFEECVNASSASDHLAVPSSPVSQFHSFISFSRDGNDRGNGLQWIERACSIISDGQESESDLTAMALSFRSYTDETSTARTSPCRSECEPHARQEQMEQSLPTTFATFEEAKKVACLNPQAESYAEDHPTRTATSPNRRQNAAAPNGVKSACAIPPDHVLQTMSNQELEGSGWQSYWPQHSRHDDRSNERTSLVSQHRRKSGKRSWSQSQSHSECASENRSRFYDKVSQGESSRRQANETVPRQFYEIKAQIQHIPENGDPNRFQTNGRCYVACDACKRRKMRCTNELPACSNCIRRGATCKYAAKARTRGRARSITTDADDSLIPTASASSVKREPSVISARPLMDEVVNAKSRSARPLKRTKAK